MSVIKKLGRMGNSSAVLLDRTTLEHLGLSPDDYVQISISGNSLIITRAGAGIDAQLAQARAAAERLMDKHDDTFKELAR